jgi:hypothetical protein
MNSTFSSIITRTLQVSLLGLLLSACSDGNNNGGDQGAVTLPFAELVEQGVTRYLGLYSPMSTTEADGVVNYRFGAGDGPLCLDGSTYTMATRDEGTEDLMIFLQGGGACWFGVCSATESASEGIPALGILDPGLAANPLAGMSTVYLPYCDGGLHASDADRDSDGDGTADRFHRGLHNLSAALDVAVTTFPAPRRIVLAGISGGGYGTIFALPLVSQLYPGVPIEVLNDSGLGITRPADVDFNSEIVDYWNIGAFFPDSCPECRPQGASTEFLDWQLQEDPTLRLGLLSYSRDFVIGDFFLGIGGDAFEAVMRETTAELESRNPGRVRSFIAAGTAHTFLGSDLSLSVEGVSLSQWVGAMLDDIEGNWTSVSE